MTMELTPTIIGQDGKPAGQLTVRLCTEAASHDKPGMRPLAVNDNLK